MEEQLVALDSSGQEINAPVTRHEAHRTGVWHRSVGLVVLNSRGEILLEKRALHKDLFPGAYDIPGGHVKHGSDSDQTALEELREELGLALQRSRLIPVGLPDQVVERVILPAQGFVNLERKTVYRVELSDQEEDSILSLALEWSALSDRELEGRGAFGEVTAVEFWHFEALASTLRRTPAPVASGTTSVFADESVFDVVRTRCLELRASCRERVFALLPVAFANTTPTDEFIHNLMLGRLDRVASDSDCAAVFIDGKDTTAGAYPIARFRSSALFDRYWREKLADPYRSYVDNLGGVLRRSDAGQSGWPSDDDLQGTKQFVSETMNLPLLDGRRFRDSLGNLSEITASRNAALLWLSQSDCDRQGPPVGESIRWLTEECLSASHRLLVRVRDGNRGSAGPDRIKRLLRASLGACAAEFNNADFQRSLPQTKPASAALERFCLDREPDELPAYLGGDEFIDEFIVTCSSARAPFWVAYLPGNSCQAYLSLAICEELLALNPNVRVALVPKSTPVANDLDYSSLRQVLLQHGASLFATLLECESQGRFIVSSEGPTTNGIDPSRLTVECASILRSANAIVAEGQAYAEIRGWRRPTYLSFRVNGRVAEAIHGVPRGSCGFVGLLPEVQHFTDIEAYSESDNRGPDIASGLGVRQTTRLYVQAVLSQNFSLLSERLFQGDIALACDQIQSEAKLTDKTFADVILGVFEPPSGERVMSKFSRLDFPVFACGGGGGFNAVTLKALKLLDIPVVAGVPSTDDGGNSGELQKWLLPRRGFVFGVGDMGAILQDSLENGGKQAVLAYRFDEEPDSLCAAVLDRIVDELRYPTYVSSPLGATPDLLYFVANQLNLARAVDGAFRQDSGERLPVKGASIRNLNIVAAYEMCGCLGSQNQDLETNGLKAYSILQESLGVPSRLLVVPVTYDPALLFVQYDRQIDDDLRSGYGVPDDAVSADGFRLYGQRYIDKLPQPGRRVLAGVVQRLESPDERPSANPEFLARLHKARLFMMGAGSLIGSQLAQLAVKGVIETLLEKQDCRRILVLNHVTLDETLGMRVRDQVELIESIATAMTSTDGGRGISERHRVRIGDLFTDVVIPRTVARELERRMASGNADTALDDRTRSVKLWMGPGQPSVEISRNRFVDSLLSNPQWISQLGITRREVEVLAALEQDRRFTSGRSEKGRYRSPLFAANEDIDYLVAQGIQARNIHEVDSIGENWKLVKAEGTASFEFFPGLVPEALMAIIRIALERGMDPVRFV